MRGAEEKVEEALFSLISLKSSRQDNVCLGCSAPHCLEFGSRERERELETELVKERERERAREREREKEREHFAFSNRLLPTIAESGTLYIRLTCVLCRLPWV